MASPRDEAPRATRIPAAAWLLAGVLGVALTATVVPGVFTIDEDHYLVSALGPVSGRVSVPGTEGLPPSRELAWFDPVAQWRRVEASPVHATVPPLYAFLALPFTLLGFRGLVLLNTLAFLGTALLLFWLAARLTRAPAAPWLAAGAFALSGFGLEYAQGLWPQSLAVFLCTGAWACASRARSTGRLRAAVGAGLLAGLAAGVRYQDVVVAGALGLGLLLASGHRVRLVAAYAAGLAAPLSASSLLNHLRLGTWNPLTKGTPGYLSLAESAEAPREAMGVLLGRVVDMARYPPFLPAEALRNPWASRDAVTDAFVVVPGALKKSLLQSSPWMLLAFVFVALALLAFRRRDAIADELRTAGLVVGAILFTFVIGGTGRHDGLTFNQRYLLEAVPFAALALALGLAEWPLLRAALALGVGTAGVLGGLVALSDLTVPVQQALLYVPLALSVVAVLALALPRRPWALSLALGATLGWGFAVHVGHDLPASREVRSLHRRACDGLSTVLPAGPSALLSCGSAKLALGPLLLGRDLVVIDPCADRGEASEQTVAALLGAGRRVLVYASGIPEPLLDRLAGRFGASERRVDLGPGWEPLRVLELGGGRPGG